MPTNELWQLIQSWMDGQIVRVNQSQLADAIGVNRQAITQWKLGDARPSPESLRALHRVTRIDWHLLTEALLHDMGYVEDEESSHGTTTTRTGSGKSDAGAPTLSEHVIAQLPPEAQEQLRAVAAAKRGRKAQPNG